MCWGHNSFRQVSAMYNRYTPNRDGTFQKDRLPDGGRNLRPAPEQAPNSPPCPPPERPPEPCPQTGSASGFLSGILPKDMDTGDLLMFLILLLLLSDGSEEAPSALLTIALFFLMR